MQDDPKFRAVLPPSERAAPMDSLTPPTVLPSGQADASEALCMVLYSYQFGTISFLELVERFEAILHIEPPAPDCHKTQPEKE